MPASLVLLDCDGCGPLAAVDPSLVGALVAIALLIGGTVAVCVALALAARLVDRLWDVLAPGEERERPVRSRRAELDVRSPVASAVARPALVAFLAAALVSALAWLAHTVSRIGDLA